MLVKWILLPGETTKSQETASVFIFHYLSNTSNIALLTWFPSPAPRHTFIYAFKGISSHLCLINFFLSLLKILSNKFLGIFCLLSSFWDWQTQEQTARSEIVSVMESGPKFAHTLLDQKVSASKAPMHLFICSVIPHACTHIQIGPFPESPKFDAKLFRRHALFYYFLSRGKSNAWTLYAGKIAYYDKSGMCVFFLLI
jgi:hypothetical protein